MKRRWWWIKKDREQNHYRVEHSITTRWTRQEKKKRKDGQSGRSRITVSIILLLSTCAFLVFLSSFPSFPHLIIVISHQSLIAEPLTTAIEYNRAHLIHFSGQFATFHKSQDEYSSSPPSTGIQLLKLIQEHPPSNSLPDHDLDRFFADHSLVPINNIPIDQSNLSTPPL